MKTNHPWEIQKNKPNQTQFPSAIRRRGPLRGNTEKLAQVTQLAGRIGVLSSDNADSWQKSSLYLYDFVDAAQPLRQRQA